MPHATPNASRPRVVVVGTGHAGIEAVRGLRRAPVDVVLVERTNYHKFQPLLYQVATAGLTAAHITQPVRHLFRGQRNVDVRLATVVGGDLDARTLHLAGGARLGYDFLVLAAGASTAYYGVEGAKEYGFPLKNVPDAVALRGHLLRQFEATHCDRALIDEGSLTVAVVGGGATGVETAGALRELFDKVLERDFPTLAVRQKARVVLIEAAGALMNGYAERLQRYTRETLERRGIEVWTDTAVERVTPGGVALADGRWLPARTVVWAAGVRAHPLADALGLPQVQGGRLAVGEALQVPGHPEVFVAGDMAGASDPGGRLYPQVAQVAIQQGRHAAASIVRRLEGLEPHPFRYRDLGQMATIGRDAAILQLPSGFTLTGFPAWLGWLFIHVVKLAGFRNQVGVFLSWVYNYFTWDRGPRLIFAAAPEPDSVDPDRDPLAEARPAAPVQAATP